MPSFILKVSPEDSAYVEWSTISDSLADVFADRAEALAAGVAPERLDRADAIGTSAKPDPAMPADHDANGGLPGSWDDEGLMAQTASGHRRWLPRTRLAEYARHQQAGRTAEADALTEALAEATDDE